MFRIATDGHLFNITTRICVRCGWSEHEVYRDSRTACPGRLPKPANEESESEGDAMLRFFRGDKK